MKATSVYHNILKIGLLSQAIALVMGMALHTSALFAGRALFYGKIFTPALDVLFVPFIVAGGLLGICGHVQSVIHPRLLRLAGIVVSMYFLISIPFHVRTILSWSTAHFMEFPETYSLFVIPLQLLFLWIVSRELRSDHRAPQGADSASDRCDGLRAAGEP